MSACLLSSAAILEWSKRFCPIFRLELTWSGHISKQSYKRTFSYQGNLVTTALSLHHLVLITSKSLDTALSLLGNFIFKDLVLLIFIFNTYYHFNDLKHSGSRWICLINVFWYRFPAFPHENAAGRSIYQYLGSYKCLKGFSNLNPDRVSGFVLWLLHSFCCPKSQYSLCILRAAMLP